MHGRPHTMRRSWPGRVAFAAVLLIAGLLISVGVAWGCALWAAVGAYPKTVGIGVLETTGWHNAPVARKNAVPPEPDLIELCSRVWALHPTAATISGRLEGPQRVTLWLGRRTGSGVQRLGYEWTTYFIDDAWGRGRGSCMLAGWPVVCVAAVDCDTAAGPAAKRFFWHGVVQLPAWLGGDKGVLKVAGLVPCLPIWPGLLFNTLFYATILWFFAFGLGFIRRARRRAKGRCVFCGYSLAGLAKGATCPECGAASAAVARTEARSTP